MEFLKKHYEKIILGVVLVGLLVALGFLPIKISSERQTIEARASALIHPHVQQLSNLDLTIPDTALKRMAEPVLVNFGDPNKVFNPMPWQQTADKRLIPGSKVGPSAVTLTNLTPLYTIVTLDDVSTSADGSLKYKIGVERQAASAAKDRSKKQFYCKVNEKNEIFTLADVKGKADDPDQAQAIIVLNDTGERAQVTRAQAFKRPDGYMVTLNYDPEHRTWVNRRVGATFMFNFEEYKIVAINQNEVVLSATSNQKKWTIKYNPTS
jgi:hypothetical protein